MRVLRVFVVLLLLGIGNVYGIELTSNDVYYMSQANSVLSDLIVPQALKFTRSYNRSIVEGRQCKIYLEAWADDMKARNYLSSLPVNNISELKSLHLKALDAMKKSFDAAFIACEFLDTDDARASADYMAQASQYLNEAERFAEGLETSDKLGRDMREVPEGVEAERRPVISETAEIRSEELSSFVDSFIDATDRGDVATLLGFYDDVVDFYGKTFTKDDILKDKENYYRRWKVVNVNRDGEVVIEDKGDNRKELVFPIKFFVENPGKNKAISGSAINTLVVKRIDHKLKIVLEDQKITGRREYAPKPLASKPQVQKEEVQVQPKVQLKEQIDAGNEQRFNASVNTYAKWLKEEQPDTTKSQKAYLCRNIESESSLSDNQKEALRNACEIVGYQTKPSTVPLKQTDPWGEVTW